MGSTSTCVQGSFSTICPLFCFSRCGKRRVERGNWIDVFPFCFLLIVKVYAPLTEKDSTFHRTLFLFMCTSMTCLLKDQHEQWKRNQDKQSRRYFFTIEFRCVTINYHAYVSFHLTRITECVFKVSRSSVANCPVITLFTPVNPQETMGKINLLVLEVIPWKDLLFSLVNDSSWQLIWLSICDYLSKSLAFPVLSTPY